MTSVPLVAVAGRVIPPGLEPYLPEPQMAVPTWYLEALGRAGGVGAVFLPGALGPDAAVAVVERVDGLLLTGGEDVDPALYGETPEPRTYGFDAAVDRWEEALYRAAVALDRPVLAICRGAQVLNVVHGGSLAQHVTGHGRPQEGVSEGVVAAVEPGSRLAAALGGELAPVGRCCHHQAVGRLGEGLAVVARADDGTVEGIEPVADAPGDPWVVGVQWHPEESAATDPVQQRLFATFVAECARRAGAPRPGA